ncbi:MAG: IS256 family transposase, partial [Bacilli bacterium]
MKRKNTEKKELVNAIIEAYQPESAKDVQDALKDIFRPMFETMLNAEMNAHLGYKSNSKEEKDDSN